MQYKIECVIDGVKTHLTTEQNGPVGNALKIAAVLSRGIAGHAKHRGTLDPLDEVSKVMVFGGMNLGGPDLIAVYRSGSRTL